MINKVKKEIKELIKKLEINCSIKEFQDKVDWNIISKFQKLSEDFIKEFKEIVNWNNISWKQKLSEDFIYDFQDKLDMDFLIENNKITKNRLLELKKINSIHSRFEILDIR